MTVYPAIDLRGGRCVRLQQGDYARETTFDEDPVVPARRWLDAGAAWLHLVDLDGARAGRPVNAAAIQAIVGLGLPCQLGGGLRTDADLDAVFGWGVQRAIIGTQALKQPDWFAAMSRRYPGRLLLGLDVREGRVATHGWLETSTATPAEVLASWRSLPLAGVVFTDIARDGMLSGVNAAAVADIVHASPFPVIVAGGVTSLDDVRTIKSAGAAGCVAGRALYEGKLNLREAIHLAQGA